MRSLGVTDCCTRLLPDGCPGYGSIQSISSSLCLLLPLPRSLCRWYSQAGTPRVTAVTSYNPSDKTFTLKLSQVECDPC